MYSQACSLLRVQPLYGSVAIVIVVGYHSADACGITSTARFSSSMFGQKVVRQ
jgi:hypothetical protein